MSQGLEEYPANNRFFQVLDHVSGLCVDLPLALLLVFRMREDRPLWLGPPPSPPRSATRARRSLLRENTRLLRSQASAVCLPNPRAVRGPTTVRGGNDHVLCDILRVRLAWTTRHSCCCSPLLPRSALGLPTASQDCFRSFGPYTQTRRARLLPHHWARADIPSPSASIVNVGACPHGRRCAWVPTRAPLNVWSA